MKKKLSKHFHINGKTIDGNNVISGVFWIYQTRGIPPEITIQTLKNRSMLCDWENFIKDAMMHGMTKDYIKTWILNIVGDVYGSKYLNEFKIRMDGYLQNV